MVDYLSIFFVAFIVSALITFPIKRLALKVNAVDHPSERKVHTKPIPRLGGVAIFIGFAISIALQFSNLISRQSDSFDFNTRELSGIFLGATLILVIGVIDDIVELPPLAKFSGQIAAASILVAFGIRMEFIGNPISGGVIYLGSLGVLLTIIWVVAFINIINFIDGLDGLAAGIAAIAALSFAFFAFDTGQIATAMISIAIVGSTLGFLGHNFNPAKIFMGDSGSMFLGFLFGAITVSGVMKSIAAISLFAPLIIMGVPILDGALAILRRYRDGQPVTQADRDHLHHRLLRRGFTQRQAVSIIYLWSIALSAFGLTLRINPSTQKYLIILFMLFLSYLFAEFIGFFEVFSNGKRVKKKELRATDEDSRSDEREVKIKE